MVIGHVDSCPWGKFKQKIVEDIEFFQVQNPSTTALTVRNNKETALAVQNAPDQNTALVALPRKRRIIVSSWYN